MIWSLIWIGLAIGMFFVVIIIKGIPVLAATVLFLGGIVLTLNTIQILRTLKYKKMLHEVSVFGSKGEEMLKEKDSDCNGCSNCQ